MMNNYESTRSDEAISGWEGSSSEVDLVADPQREPATSNRFECRRRFGFRFGAGGLSDRRFVTACLYQKYIQSSAWRASSARLAELEASGNRCRLCNSPNNPDNQLEVHHRTYARLGRELQSDLTTLCADCHRGVTSMLRARRYEATAPIRADVVLSDLRHRLLDPTREEAK